MTEQQTEVVSNLRIIKLERRLRSFETHILGDELRVEVDEVMARKMSSMGVVARLTVGWSKHDRQRSGVYNMIFFDFYLNDDVECVECSGQNNQFGQIPNDWDEALDMIGSILIRLHAQLAGKVAESLASLTAAINQD